MPTAKSVRVIVVLERFPVPVSGQSRTIDSMDGLLVLTRMCAGLIRGINIRGEFFTCIQKENEAVKRTPSLH